MKTKKVIGKFKDEAAGKPILEFVGLKSKMYSYKIGEEEHKKAKGVKKNVVKRNQASRLLRCTFQEEDYASPNEYY